MIKKIIKFLLFLIVVFIGTIVLTPLEGLLINVVGMYIEDAGIVLMFYLGILTVQFMVILPSICFWHSKKVVSKGRYKLLLSSLCPTVITCSYTLMLLEQLYETRFAGAVVVFFACEFWSLMGLIKDKPKCKDNVNTDFS